MNEAQKKRPATSAGQRNEPDTGQTGNRDVSGFASSKEPGAHATGRKPVHLSQEEAQSIPADKDPDDPVSR